MPHFSATSFTVLACLVLVCTSSLMYYKSSSDPYTRSSFTLPYLAPTTVITALVNLQGAAFSYNVELWEPQGSSPAMVTTLSGTTTYTSNPIPYAGAWRLVIVPSSAADPQFIFTINIFANNQTIGKFVDVARSSRFFTVFHNAGGNHIVSLTLPSNMAK